ncbi:MAG: hypothetical protein HY365_02895, partial [Candidatus Aenigmarchaeota archaeon]|nr:hypothetical protein [Candidatus Aenigmarchaeota archaeon]
GEYKIETPKLTLNQYMFGRRPSTEPMYGEGVAITSRHLVAGAGDSMYEDKISAKNGTVICPDIVLTAEHGIKDANTVYTSGEGAGTIILYSLRDDAERDLALFRTLPSNTYPHRNKTRIRTTPMEKGETVSGNVTTFALRSDETITTTSELFSRIFAGEGGWPYNVGKTVYNTNGTGNDVYERRLYYEVKEEPDGKYSAGEPKGINPVTEKGWSGTGIYDKHGNLAGVVVSSELSTGFAFENSDSGVEMYEFSMDSAVPSEQIIAFLRGE